MHWCSYPNITQQLVELLSQRNPIVVWGKHYKDDPQATKIARELGKIIYKNGGPLLSPGECKKRVQNFTENLRFGKKNNSDRDPQKQHRIAKKKFKVAESPVDFPTDFSLKFQTPQPIERYDILESFYDD